MPYDITLHGRKIGRIEPIERGLAPDFVLRDQSHHLIRLHDLSGPVVLSICLDVTTPVCGLQTKFFDREARKYQDIHFLGISSNPRLELKKWQQREAIAMPLLHDNGSFGAAYGLTMLDGPLPKRLVRSVYVIDQGRILHSQILSEITHEPNYHAVLATLG